MKHRDQDLNTASGKRLRICRESAGFSRERLAECMGVTSRFLADVEIGRVGMSLSSVCKASQALGVTTDALLRRDELDPAIVDRITLMLSSLNPELAEKVLENLQGQIELIHIVQKEEKR